MPELSHKELKESLRYSPDIGEFTRIRAVKGHAIGEIAGGAIQRGYIIITVNGKRCLAHRLAWFYVHGVWPRDTIDHKNRNTADNRICNLREATQSQQKYNSRGWGKVGFKGVSWSKKDQKYQSFISVSGKTVYLGSFDDPIKAHACYATAARKHYGEYWGP